MARKIISYDKEKGVIENKCNFNGHYMLGFLLHFDGGFNPSFS